MFHKLLSVLFPEQCVFCGQLMHVGKTKIAVCQRCAGRLTFLESAHTCKICGRVTKAEELICETCLTHPHYFDRAVSCFSYEGEIRRSILRYKFSGRRDYCRTFAPLLYHRILPLHQEKPFDFVVCAPLSKSARLKRGYNQAELIAKRVAQALDIPFLEGAFAKIKETPKQSTLHYAERFENVAHAFTLALPADAFRNKRILLVDDVLTTGATADALARLLKRAKAACIVVATIASTNRKSDFTFFEETEPMADFDIMF